jgi:Flp pilus assembly pilin Flp
VLDPAKRLAVEEDGASTAEYALLLAFVISAVVVAVQIYAVGILGVFTALSNRLVDLFNSI